MLDGRVIKAMARRTLRQSVESPIVYVVGIFFYGFIGVLFGLAYFMNNQASISSLVQLAPWVLWFVVPALTMGLLSEEFRMGTFESLATLPVRDWEIVLGKYLGFAALSLIILSGLWMYVLVLALTTQPKLGLDWGGTIGVFVSLYFLCLSYGAMGLFASSLTKNQVVALILGMLFCTILFMLSQVYMLFPGTLGRIADSVGVISHLESVGRGVWDLRDLFYFGSLIFVFLYFTAQRLATRRF